MDKWQLPWTQGCQAGNLVNHANWSKRLRGPHQILMWCWDSESLGSKEARLMTVSLRCRRRLSGGQPR